MLSGKVIKRVLHLRGEEIIVFVFEDNTRFCIQAKSGYYPYDVKLEYDCELIYEPSEENSYEI